MNTRMNSLANMLSTLSSAAALFVVFRISYHVLGAQLFGLWTLIQSLMLISRLSDVGSLSNLTRLVAIEKEAAPSVSVSGFLIGGLIVSTAPIAVLGVICAWPIYIYIVSSYALAAASTGAVKLLIVYSLVFGVFNSVANTIAGCLDGLGLMAARALITSLANILFMMISAIVIPRFGVTGVGAAYVVSSAATVLLLWGGMHWLHIARQKVRTRSVSVRNFVRSSIRFNIDLLVISIARLLFDPTTKLIIGAFGGLAELPTFDLATKVTSQVRILFAAGAQAILPLASRAATAVLSPENSKLFSRANGILVRFSFYAFALTVVLLPAVSLLGFQRLNNQFLMLGAILAVGNLVNSFGLVGYYIEVGGGLLIQLVRIHLAMAVANVALGVLFAIRFGATGATVAAAITVACGGVACWRLQRRASSFYVPLLEKGSFIPAGGSVLVAAVGIAGTLWLRNAPAFFIILLCTLGAVMTCLIVLHEKSTVRSLLGWRLP